MVDSSTPRLRRMSWISATAFGLNGGREYDVPIPPPSFVLFTQESWILPVLFLFSVMRTFIYRLLRSAISGSYSHLVSNTRSEHFTTKDTKAHEGISTSADSTRNSTLRDFCLSFGRFIPETE